MQLNSLINLIYNEIIKYDSDKVFSINDFLSLAEYDNVRQSLSRLEKNGLIKRVVRGFYYKPTYSKLLNEYSLPSPHHTAIAIANKYNWIIIPSKKTALNQLGLSTQVSTKYSYLSDGPYKKFMIGNIELEFKHTNKRMINTNSYKISLVIQAIDALKENISEEQIIVIRNYLNDDELNVLKKEISTKINIYNIIKKLDKIKK